MGRTVALFVAAVLCGGCNGRLPVQPSPAIVQESPGVTELKVSRVSPQAGWPLYYTEVFGSGFKPGVRLTIGGVEAPVFVAVDHRRIVTNPPWHEPGTVDVVVTNPDGISVTLVAGFTYKAATLELSKSDVGPGERLRVTWRGPHDPSDFAPPDIIGVYAAADPHSTALWSTYSGAGDQFSQEFQAPTNPGAYEVRYYMLSQYLLVKMPLTVR